MLTTKVIVVYVLKVSRQLNVYVILSNVLDVCILPDGDDVMPALDCECESGLASRSTEVSLAVLGAPKTSLTFRNMKGRAWFFLLSYHSTIFRDSGIRVLACLHG